MPIVQYEEGWADRVSGVIIRENGELQLVVQRTLLSNGVQRRIARGIVLMSMLCHWLERGTKF